MSYYYEPSPYAVPEPGFDPLSRPCPTCTAEPGQPCRTRKPIGTYRTPEHFQSWKYPGVHQTRAEDDADPLQWRVGQRLFEHALWWACHAQIRQQPHYLGLLLDLVADLSGSPSRRDFYMLAWRVHAARPALYREARRNPFFGRPR